MLIPCNIYRSKNAHISFPDLDVVKLLMALLVVEIHVKPLMSLGSDTANVVVLAVDSVAVPFFFIASAFLWIASKMLL